MKVAFLVLTCVSLCRAYPMLARNRYSDINPTFVEMDQSMELNKVWDVFHAQQREYSKLPKPKTTTNIVQKMSGGWPHVWQQRKIESNGHKGTITYSKGETLKGTINYADVMCITNDDVEVQVVTQDRTFAFKFDTFKAATEWKAQTLANMMWFHFDVGNIIHRVLPAIDSVTLSEGALFRKAVYHKLALSFYKGPKVIDYVRNGKGTTYRIERESALDSTWESAPNPDADDNMNLRRSVEGLLKVADCETRVHAFTVAFDDSPVERKVEFVRKYLDDNFHSSDDVCAKRVANLIALQSRGISAYPVILLNALTGIKFSKLADRLAKFIITRKADGTLVSTADIELQYGIHKIAFLLKFTKTKDSPDIKHIEFQFRVNEEEIPNEMGVKLSKPNYLLSGKYKHNAGYWDSSFGSKCPEHPE